MPNLSLRQDQVDALAAGHAENFEVRIGAVLRERYPERPLGDGFVEEAIAEGRSFGIDDRDDLLLWVDFVFRNGLEFAQDEEMEWAVDIVSDEALSGRRKVQLLDHGETFGR